MLNWTFLSRVLHLIDQQQRNTLIIIKPESLWDVVRLKFADKNEIEYVFIIYMQIRSIPFIISLH